MNKQYVSENRVWIPNSKGSKGGLVYPCPYPAVGITTMFNSLVGIKFPPSSWGKYCNFLFGIQFCLLLELLHELFGLLCSSDQKDDQEFVKAKTVICMGQVMTWRSLLHWACCLMLLQHFLLKILLDPKPSGRYTVICHLSCA